MSQSAKKLSAPPIPPAVRAEDGSGRYVIDSDRLEALEATMLPPADGVEEVLSLDAIGGLELPPDAIDDTPPALPNTVSDVYVRGQGLRAAQRFEADPEAEAAADAVEIDPTLLHRHRANE